MGKATIVSNLGAGYYRIKVLFDNTEIEAKKDHIDEQIAAIDANLETLETQRLEQAEKVTAAVQAMNDYIDSTPVFDYIKEPTQLDALLNKTYDERIKYDGIVNEIRRENYRRTALEKEKAYLEINCPSDFETNAWCVAFNESLSGDIDTIEVDYLLERDVNTNQIRNDTGFWLPDGAGIIDSQLQHPNAGSPHSVWFNLCVLPAMQKERGRFRIATLTSVDKDNDTCNLTFDGRYDVDEYTSALIDDLPILPYFPENDAQQLNYTGADIVYGKCNAEVFEAGDRVIVDLNGAGTQATVVGFYENPKRCRMKLVYIADLLKGYINGETLQTVEYESDGTPVTAVALDGYFFTKWSDNLTEATRQELNVQDDGIYTALFVKKDGYRVSFNTFDYLGGVLLSPATDYVYSYDFTHIYNGAATGDTIKYSDETSNHTVAPSSFSRSATRDIITTQGTFPIVVTVDSIVEVVEGAIYKAAETADGDLVISTIIEPNILQKYNTYYVDGIGPINEIIEDRKKYLITDNELETIDFYYYSRIPLTATMRYGVLTVVYRLKEKRLKTYNFTGTSISYTYEKRESDVYEIYTDRVLTETTSTVVIDWVTDNSGSFSVRGGIFYGQASNSFPVNFDYTATDYVSIVKI